MRLGLAGVLAILLLSAPARAWVVSEDPIEGDSFTVGGSVRQYELLLYGGPLSSALSPPGANPTAISLLALRPLVEWKSSSGLKLVAHYQLDSTLSSTPLEALGGSLALGHAAPTWLPLQWSPVTHDTYQLRHRVDWAYARYTGSSVSFTLGRQPISLGRGQIFTPEDVLAPFSPLQLDTTYKPGADAARLDLALGSSLSLLVLGAAARDGNSAALARLELQLERARVAVFGGDVRTDALAGLDLFVDLGHGTDLHGEATSSWVTSNARRPWGRRAFARAELGTTTELSSTLHVTAEAYFNGAGARHARDYLVELAGPRVALGESYTAGRLYAGLASDWQAHPLLHVDLAVLTNLEDGSSMLAPTLRYAVSDNASLVAGGFVGLGKASRGADGFTPRSEFGSYPGLCHVDAKLWF